MNLEQAARMALDLIEMGEKYPKRIRGSYPKEVIAALREALSQPEDPKNIILPVDVKVGHGTIKAGCSLQTLLVKIAMFNESWEPKLLKGTLFAKEREIMQCLEQQQGEPVAWMCSSEKLLREGYSRFSQTKQGDWNIPVYTTQPVVQQDNLNCKSVQARLATSWGYVKAQPQEPVACPYPCGWIDLYSIIVKNGAYLMSSLERDDFTEAQWTCLVATIQHAKKLAEFGCRLRNTDPPVVQQEPANLCQKATELVEKAQQDCQKCL